MGMNSTMQNDVQSTISICTFSGDIYWWRLLIAILSKFSEYCALKLVDCILHIDSIMYVHMPIVLRACWGID